jgi:hypothetical protein
MGLFPNIVAVLLSLITQWLEWALTVSHLLLQIDLRWPQHTYEMLFIWTKIGHCSTSAKHTSWKKYSWGTFCKKYPFSTVTLKEQYTKEWKIFKLQVHCQMKRNLTILSYDTVYTH